VAIGYGAGENNQGGNSVAIGLFVGQTTQSGNSVAIGQSAGSTNQRSNSIAIGTGAGASTLGEFSIALGNNAGPSGQHTKTTVINASGTPLATSNADALYIKPIRPAANTYYLKYNIQNGEITYSL